MSEDQKKEVTIFAKTNFRNQEVPFGIKTDDRRRHIYIIGKTGMGKTTLMENMIIQDIQNGRGLAFVDPHGDSVEKILQYIPNSRVNDVVYINPSDQDFPIAFNVLESVDPRYKHLVASGLMGVFTKIWANMWSARMEYILNNAILALLDSPGNTLLGIARMLIDKKYRKKIVDNVKDPIVRSFWTDEFANWNEKYRNEAIAPIQNKVGQFLSSSIIRNIIGQPRSTIDLREIMDNKKILLLNLSKGRLGEDNSSLLGAMIITKLQLAALSRVDVLESEREDFYLYVDEFQNFATKSFATILSEARKYRLNLVVGHQYIGQLVQEKNTEVRDAVFGNVGTIITFRVGAADAEYLEKEFFPTFLQNDLVNLPKHTIILRLMINGVASDPFTATTLAPSTYEKTDNEEKVIRISRERYANKVGEIEEKITRWMGQDFHEQVAVIASDVLTEQEIQERDEKEYDEAETKQKINALAAEEKKTFTEPENTSPKVPVSKIQLSESAQFMEMAAPEVPLPSPSPISKPVAPKDNTFKTKNQKSFEKAGSSFNKQRKANQGGNKRKENPIWGQVATLTDQKIKSTRQEEKHLVNKITQNIKTSEQQKQHSLPADIRKQDALPEKAPHKSEKNSNDKTIATEQNNPEKIILKPGQSAKING
jgi:hypothetical protein